CCLPCLLDAQRLPGLAAVFLRAGRLAFGASTSARGGGRPREAANWRARRNAPPSGGAAGTAGGVLRVTMVGALPSRPEERRLQHATAAPARRAMRCVGISGPAGPASRCCWG